MTIIQSLVKSTKHKGFTIQGIIVSLKSIDAACEGLYLDERFAPHYILLSQVDHDVLYQEIKKATFSPDKTLDTIEIPTIRKLVNQTTGFAMDVFVSDSIPQGVLLLGRFEV